MGCHVVSLLCSMEEKEGEDQDDWNGSRALTAWESNWGKTDEFVTKYQFLRQDSATRKDGLGFHFDLVFSSDLRSGQSSSHFRAQCSSYLAARMRKK